MTADGDSREFGVQWSHSSGRSWVSGGFTLTGAQRTVANVADWPGYAAVVVVREPGEWLLLEPVERAS